MQPTPHFPPGNLSQTQQNGSSAEPGTKVRAANASASEQAGQSRPGTFKQAIGWMQRQGTSADPETQGSTEETTTEGLYHPVGGESPLQDAMLPLNATAMSQGSPHAAASTTVSSATRLGGQSIDRATSLTAQLTRAEPHLGSEQRTAVLQPEGTGKMTSLSPIPQELFNFRSEGLAPSLSAAAGAEQAASTQSHPSTAPAGTRAVWATVPMDAAPGKWGEQMLQVLQDRVYLQASQQMQEARIRLDPPDLGKLDLVVRVDGDRLNVQINANHSAVRDALVQVSDRLRAELAQQQFVHVDVNVGSGEQGRGEQAHTQHEEDHYQPVIHQASEPSTTTITGTPDEHWLSTTA
ncbi:flagellar hook-length control protein FliK [Photobacterium sp. TY1-4]|uniref:flagellar hook-length control protein FliK n=1 Tax=Photobacterium sp. TY1-4 TaxID=2899122 RepID=UPI0021C14BC8|nr:flagellar hook-length control protein FliK [Photobacterium sp. TY1-4]UXI03075.1 flagellar hook-length control protein FliK [Photobacterium sp. TY1-4]